MTRNLKALGLALVAMFAMSAMAASAAQAVETPHFTTYNTAKGVHESANLTASATGSQTFKATATSELALTCSELSAEGTTATGTDTTQTITNIQFKGDAPEGTCTTKPGELPVHVYMNGCHFQFHIDEPLKVEGEEGDWWGGHVGIKCTGETKHIIVEVTKSVAAGGGTKCTITIGEQENAGKVEYHNTTDKTPTDIDVISQAVNIQNETAGGLLNCGVANGVHATGVYEGAATVTAKNTEGEPIDLTAMNQNTP